MRCDSTLHGNNGTSASLEHAFSSLLSLNILHWYRQRRNTVLSGAAIMTLGRRLGFLTTFWLAVDQFKHTDLGSNAGGGGFGLGGSGSAGDVGSAAYTGFFRIFRSVIVIDK